MGTRNGVNAPFKRAGPDGRLRRIQVDQVLLDEPRLLGLQLQLVADRILRYAAIVGRENIVAGTDCGLGSRVHADLARRSRLGFSGKESNTARPRSK